MEKIILLIPIIPIVIAFTLLFVKQKELIPKVSILFSSMIALLALSGTYYVISYDTEITGFGGLVIYNQLSAILVPYVAILGLVIRRYATKYMWDEAGYKRFFILLNFIFASIYLLVMSNNLIILALAWQLMSVGLYLLVSFSVGSKTAVKNARWTMYIHKSADFVFILAVILTYNLFHSFDLVVLKEQWLIMSQSSIDNPMIFAVGLLYLLAAMMKSAIVPFHIWLPYTSEAPTPVSGLMHAGVVNVGGILLNKMAYLLILTPAVLNIAFVIGLFTAIFASMLMLVVSDVKRSLGYSTVGQMGYMIMEVGLGAFTLAVYHLIVHGIFKATLFLGSGSIIKYARGESNIPERLSQKIFSKEKLKYYNTKTLSLIAIYTIVPVVGFIIVKAIIDPAFFEFNATIIILAFAWLTGTQFFLSFFKAYKPESPKVIIGVIISFILVMFTYEYIGLALEHFFYGHDSLLFYKAATMHVTLKMALITALLLMTIGLYFIFSQSSQDSATKAQKPNKTKWQCYKFLSNEGYYFDMFKNSKKGKL
jgi:NADH-quinone oxidoreductase subunit L